MVARILFILSVAELKKEVMFIQSKDKLRYKTVQLISGKFKDKLIL
jgi:hypothetical protein